MAVAIVMDFPGATLDHYDAVITRMGFEPGGSPPEGAICHFVVKTDEGVRVTDVWKTKEQFDAFARDHIGPASQAVGVPGPPVTTVYEVHNHFV